MKHHHPTVDVLLMKNAYVAIISANQLLPHGGDFFTKLIADGHAPTLPDYSYECQAEVDVLRGCHKTVQALNIEESGKKVTFYDLNAAVVFFRIKQFLEAHRTKFDFSATTFWFKIARSTT